MKHISDSERLTIAALNRRETELKEAYEKINNYEAQLRAMKEQITELKHSNRILCSQISYLFSKHIHHV